MCNKIDDLKYAYDKLVEVQKEAKLYADEIYIEQDEYIDLLMKNKAIQRVRKLHSPTTVHDNSCGDPECCGSGAGGEWIECEECFEDYPCPTIKALDGEQE